MKHGWTGGLAEFRLIAKRVLCIAMLGVVLTGCSENAGPPDDVAAVKELIKKQIFSKIPHDQSELESIRVAVQDEYAVSSWAIDFGSNTTYLRKSLGKWKVLGTDFGWISYCDLKKYHIPEDIGGPLLQFIWHQGHYHVAGEEIGIKVIFPLDPKDSCIPAHYHL